MSKLVEFSIGDSLLFPPETVHGIRCAAEERVVVLGLMLHAPGAGHAPEEFVRWATEGHAAGQLKADELAALYNAAQADASESAPAEPRRAYDGSHYLQLCTCAVAAPCSTNMHQHQRSLRLQWPRILEPCENWSISTTNITTTITTGCTTSRSTSSSTACGGHCSVSEVVARASFVRR